MSLKNFMSYEDATTVIGAVKDAIDAAVSSAYHHAGTKTVAQLTHDLLVAANEGNVYNITDSGTTTSDFIEGIGKTIDEGSNVGICKVGDVYKFDLLSGFVDTTNFVQKSQSSGLLKNDGTVNTTIEDDVDSLKSGLTNYENQNNLNLEVPNRVNLWDGNYTDISAQTVTYKPIKVADGNYTISTTCPQNSLNGANIFFLSGNVQEGASTAGNGVWVDHSKTVASANGYITIAYKLDGGVDPRNYDTQIEYGSTATAYAPYIPSVESRIEAVESGLANLFEKGEFNIACVPGRNIFNIATATLISGSLPSNMTNCIMMINNHGSEQNVPNTIEIDGSDQFMINAVSAQNLRVFWVKFN